MRTFRIPATLALCLVLSACGAAPSPVQAPTPGGGGGTVSGELAAEEVPDAETSVDAVAPPTEPAATAAPTASPAALTGSVPAPTPTPVATAPTTSAGPNGPTAPAPTPTPTPTPTATATPTPTPSATPDTAETRTLTVLGDRHLVTLSRYQSFGTSPFEIVSIEADAYARPGVKFPALAGATRGRYGWKYERITPETASGWSGDIGGPGEVFFLDSVGGEADNSGRWVVLERYDDGTRTHEIRTEIDAKVDVNGFDPAQVAFANLGDAVATWTLTGAWEGAQDAPTSFPAGCFVVYTRADGVRDFAVVGPGSATIQARGYVYGFFVTANGEKPDGNLRFTLTKQ